MTVEELIEELKKCHSDGIVTCDDIEVSIVVDNDLEVILE